MPQAIHRRGGSRTRPTRAFAVFLCFSLLSLHNPGPIRAQGSALPPDLDLYPVLYRRPDAALADSTNAVQVVLVGDVSLARGVADVTAQRGSDYPLAAVAPWLQTADLAVGNYEGVIAAETVGARRPGPLRLRAEPEAAGALARAGFDLLTLANNHTLDWGAEGLRATAERLRGVGIQTVGAGADVEEAARPLVADVQGVKLVWLAFTLVADPPEVDPAEGWLRAALHWAETGKLIAAIRAARPLGDALVVQLHWGHEYTLCPAGWQYQMARAAVEAGAALVIGHHPHVVQKYEAYHNGFIAYSLGNFVFDQERRPGLAVWARFDKRGLIDVRGLTLQSGLRPEWQSPASAAANLRDLCTPSGAATKVFGYREGSFGPLDLSLSLPERCFGDGARQIGAVDLQGDGATEQVTLRDGVLTVYQDGRTVYASYPAWYVADAAPGDPNQDGRFEVLMLLWKQDRPGVRVTTHPFILGYRRGAYRIIWGGSETANWLQDVAVADLDGDRLDELITIERPPDAVPCAPLARIVVLNWNGWGFTRRWSSPPGAFRALAIERPGNGGLPVIAAR